MVAKLAQIDSAPAFDHLRSAEVTLFTTIVDGELAELIEHGDACRAALRSTLAPSESVAALLEQEWDTAVASKRSLHTIVLFASHGPEYRQKQLEPPQQRMLQAIKLDGVRECWLRPVEMALNVTKAACGDGSSQAWHCTRGGRRS